jgi:hypothetical protein
MSAMKQVRISVMFGAWLFLPLLSINGLATPKPIVTTELLQALKKGEPWDRSVFSANKLTYFQQSNSSAGTNASVVSKITLAYFTSLNCTGNKEGSGFYTTPNGSSFPIQVGTTFGFVAASAWNVGQTQLAISDMTSIKSIAVTFKSTNENTPQSCFGADCGTTGSNRSNFVCLPVNCAGGECLSTAPTPQTFQLKTTVSLGDPADGGVIACLDGGLLDVIAAKTDISSTTNCWSPSSDDISTTEIDGRTNTQTITTQYGIKFSYAARSCQESVATGGYTSGWFLPATTQLSCLYTNRSYYSFAGNTHWASTQFSPTNAVTVAYTNKGTVGNFSKSTSCTGRRVHCARAMS